MFAFHPYGLMIALGIIVGLAVAWWRKKVYGITENDLENLFILTVPLGIIGARIYHVLDKWSYYSQNLWQILAVWNGGLGIYGGVLGGLVGLGIFLRIKNFTSRKRTCSEQALKILNLLDFLMPSLAIGQAIGRWGNFFNHEVFGPPTNLPWGWYIPVNLRPEMWKNYSFFQPTFAYESLWVLTGFFILLFLERKKYHHGFLTGFYAVWYGSGRFFFEFLRFDTAEIWGIKTAQIISLLLIVFGFYLIIGRNRVLQRQK